MTTIVVRLARPQDHDAIVALPGLGRSTRRLLADDLAGALPRHVVVAEDEVGRVVGVVMSTRQPDEVHLLDLAISPASRRGGIATRLVARLATLARADGASAMTLEVRVSNAPGRGLYRSLGFSDRGARPGYYQDGEDARILWHTDLRDLADHARPDGVAAGFAGGAGSDGDPVDDGSNHRAAPATTGGR